MSRRYPNVCPVCGADPFKPCRTRTTHRVTDTHQDRIWMQHASPTPTTVAACAAGNEET